jgi:8-oxo-dGTP pyrophosphatase MutT (NUDIX family)
LTAAIASAAGNALSKRKPITQYAALPFMLKNGRPRVMLVTSRGRGQWIIPKGWPEKQLRPHASAAKEAYEEAGILGRIDERSIGSYRYEKRGQSGEMTTFEVTAYLLEVEHELRDWPEKGQRRKRWVAPAKAARLVAEEGLGLLLLKLDAAHGPGKRRWSLSPKRGAALSRAGVLSLGAALQFLAKLVRLRPRTKLRRQTKPPRR